MLCGMIGPTSGDAYVFGSSITDNMTGVRKVLGVCPQHDILYDLLTVQEHLELFAAIKDIPSEEVQVQIADMIAQVGLTEKVHDKSAALSGGMKRKLRKGKKERGEGERGKRGERKKRRKKEGKKEKKRNFDRFLIFFLFLLSYSSLSHSHFSLVQRWYRVARRFKDCLLG